MIRDNAIVNDGLVIAGDRVHLADIRVPFLTVLANRDHIVPEASAAPLIDLVGLPDKHELRLDGGHVGLLVGGWPNRRQDHHPGDHRLPPPAQRGTGPGRDPSRSASTTRRVKHDQPREVLPEGHGWVGRAGKGQRCKLAPDRSNADVQAGRYAMGDPASQTSTPPPSPITMTGDG